MTTLTLHDGRELHTHDADQCAGEVCPVHNPSDHKYRSWGHAWNGKHMLRTNGTNTVIDPDDYLFNLYGEALLENSVECGWCGDKIYSRHRHDYRTCSCGETMVDGGLDYLRRGGSNWFETSVVVERD